MAVIMRGAFLFGVLSFLGFVSLAHADAVGYDNDSQLVDDIKIYESSLVVSNQSQFTHRVYLVKRRCVEAIPELPMAKSVTLLPIRREVEKTKHTAVRLSLRSEQHDHSAEHLLHCHMVAGVNSRHGGHSIRLRLVNADNSDQQSYVDITVPVHYVEDGQEGFTDFNIAYTEGDAHRVELEDGVLTIYDPAG